MPSPMHEGQVTLPESAVALIVAEALPGLATLPVTRIDSDGTVNALYRVGEQTVARFPLVPDAGRAQHEAIISEHAALSLMGMVSPCAIPRSVAVGESCERYEGFWSALRWIDGTPLQGAPEPATPRFAAELGGFVSAISSIPTNGRSWNGRSRGGPLTTRNNEVEAALESSRHLLDVDEIADVWRCCLGVATATRDHWIHGDLMPGNLLHQVGNLHAVIDFGCAAIGDPAVDLMPAWNLLDS